MQNNSDPTGLAPRRAALRLLSGIMADHKLLLELIGAGSLDRLSTEDRARAQRLAGAVLRGVGRADAILDPHLRKRPPLAVLNALRLGTVELAGGAAAHGVVNTIVSLVGQGKRTASYRGLANAVLRKIADNAPQVWARLPPPKLARWLRGPLSEAWGRPSVAAMEAVWAEAPPLDLTPNGDAAALAEMTGGTVLPTGTVRLDGAVQVSALPGFETGDFWVQDAAAAIPARILNAQPGEKVLDMCAAPGGKTMQLAAAGAHVTALDASTGRLARLEENLVRTRLSARVVATDALGFDEAGWDAILLDAPCSATGTIRRHPDLPFAKDGGEFPALFDLQHRMIDHAVGLLRPGGRLVYCTCSLLPDEGEVQAEEALARHPQLAVDTLALDAPWIEPEWRTEEGGLRLRPDHWAPRGGMDGFYVATLRKAG